MTYLLSIILFNILYNFQSILSYTLVNKLPLGKGYLDIESIEYDSTNNEYLIASWYEGTIIPFTETEIDSAIYDINNDSQWRTTFNNFPVNIWRDSGAGRTPFNNTNVIWNTSTWRPAGMEIINNKLYVVDFFKGRISKFDISTATYESSTFITNTQNMPANLDGLCHNTDPSYSNMLYATDYGYNTGYESVYAIDTNDWSYEIIYNKSTNVIGADNGYIIKPNGCVVVNNILYTTDFNQTIKNGFCAYNITTNIWTVNYDILPDNGGDGLVYIDEINTFYITDYEDGTLLKYENNIDNKFMIVYEGMNGPADMSYNNIMKVLAIPELTTGFVNFIKLDDILFATTTEYFTTTNTQSETTKIVDETTQEEIKPTKKPDDIIIGAAGTVGFIVTCIISLIMVLVV